jgi:hypothetical protein
LDLFMNIFYKGSVYKFERKLPTSYERKLGVFSTEQI